MKIGIIGGGQLAMMLAEAAKSLKLDTLCLEASANCPASHVTEVITAEYDDLEQLNALADQADVITYEFENIPVETLKQLKKPVYPPVAALEITQDRLNEKQLFTQLDIPTTNFASADFKAELDQAITTIGYPAVIKTRRFGYDGKGQFVVRNVEDLEAAWKILQGNALLIENMIKFEQEVSIVAARSVKGEIAYYPLFQNHHINGILATSTSPYINPELQLQAEQHAKKILEHLDYVGVMAVEFFDQQGTLIANEIAPRVHNSGHGSIEGNQTSQFENHLRAIAGLELGDTAAKGQTIMLNLISELPDLNDATDLPAFHLHDYHKAPRPNRKLAHITVSSESNETFNAAIDKTKALLTKG